MTRTAPRRRAGRPRLLEVDPTLSARIATLVRAGAHPAQAAQACGVATTTHHRWVAAGLDERAHQDTGGRLRPDWSTWAEYVDALERADAEAEMLLLAKATRGGQDAAGALKVLERRWPWWSPAGTTEPVSLYGRRGTQSQAGAAHTSAATPLDALEARRASRRHR